jgi:hypothetical protein
MSKVQKVQGFGTVSDKSDKVGAAAGVRRWRADGDRLGWEERALAVFVVGVVSCVCVCLDLGMARGLPHQTSSPCSRLARLHVLLRSMGSRDKVHRPLLDVDRHRDTTPGPPIATSL